MKDMIILETRDGKHHREYDKTEYQVGQSRDIILIMPVNDPTNFERKFYRPYWEVKRS